MIAALLTGLATLAQAGNGDGAPAQAPGGGGLLGNPLIVILPMIAIFYFMLIRPQQKRQKEMKEWISNLKKGDEVVTTGGVVGRITGLAEHTVTLEVQEKVRIKVLRSHVASSPPKPGSPAQPPAAAQGR